MPDAPKIVVLDGHTLNPGDLSWDRLRALGRCEIYDRSTAAEVLKRAAGAAAILINKVPISREVLTKLPELKYIGVSATGHNVVDSAAAREQGIAVTNVPIYGTRSVAQMVFAHLLNITQNVGGHAAAVRDDRWSRAIDWCFWDTPLVELDGLTMGLVGLGRIGQATAQLANAFGMKVIGYSRSAGSPHDFIQLVELNELFRTSDVISLHCPLTPETEKIVNRERLSLMKSTAILINTSRGQLVDEAALAAALNAGQIAGAGLDVLAHEPARPDNPLITAKNCQITPHIAWATSAARARLLNMAVDNLAAFLTGKPIHVVN